MRKKSFKILYDVFYNKVLLNDAINETFMGDVKDIDKAFIKKETTGVIEKLDDIDLLIDKYSKVKTKKLNSDILVAFRLAVYEMLYMDKVPPYATINEYVNIIKKSKSARLSSYVNAVLRNIQRGEIDKKDKNAEIRNCYFRTYNDSKLEVLDELDTKNVKYAEYDGTLNFDFAKVYTVDRYKEIIDTKCFKEGKAIIEDASSIHLTDVLCKFLKEYDKEEIAILDTCSAPGGKILGVIDLLSRHKESIEVVACDISEEKVCKITDNIKRLISNHSDKTKFKIDVYINDATLERKDFIDRFDLVICDVPCTGLGVIDKKPDIKLNYSDKKRDELSLLQRKILCTSSKYVKKDGYLSYSTCTETKEENEDNVKAFLSKNKNFKLVYEKKIKRRDENRCDGFYMSVMRYGD